MPLKSDKPVMNDLLGDEAARGIELAVTPIVFGWFGWLLDGWLGTTPWLALVLGALALVAAVAKLWYGYDARMRELETTGPWARRAAGAEAAPPVHRDLWAERKVQP